MYWSKNRNANIICNRFSNNLNYKSKIKYCQILTDFFSSLSIFLSAYSHA